MEKFKSFPAAFLVLQEIVGASDIKYLRKKRNSLPYVKYLNIFLYDTRCFYDVRKYIKFAVILINKVIKIKQYLKNLRRKNNITR